MILAFDIGGTEIKTSIFGDTFEKLLYTNKFKTETVKTEKILNDFFKEIDHVNVNFKLTGIAISCPGIVDKGYVKKGGSVSSLDNIYLGKILQQKYKIPVTIRNDAQCVLLAETQLGTLSQERDGVILTLGTGVGGGIMLNRELLFLRNSMSGEFSYMIHSYDASGNFVRVGQKLSATQMIKRVNNYYYEGDEADGYQAFEHILKKEEYALKQFELFCRGLAGLIINIQSVLHVKKVVIGGGISANPIVTKNIQRQLQLIYSQDNMYNSFSQPEVVASRFLNYSGRVGAYLNFKKLIYKGMQK